VKRFYLALKIAYKILRGHSVIYRTTVYDDGRICMDYGLSVENEYIGRVKLNGIPVEEYDMRNADRSPTTEEV
jgi:hypothetical protein